MAEATEQEIRDMIPDLQESIDSDTISLYLTDAKSQIIGHGIAESHARFSIMQRFLTLHLLSLANLAGKNVLSESVSDVSINFSDDGSGTMGTLYATNWEREYQKVRISILGMTDICL